MMVSMGIFKLNAKATEEDAMAALQNVANDFSALETLRTEKKTLEDENKALKLSRNTSLVKDAVAANKIKAEDEPMYLELVNSNYESTKKILDGIKPHISLSSRTNGASGAEGSEDKYKGWNMDRFRKEAPLELARIRKEEPDRFKQLFNEKFAKQ
jgi:hypothetical protein